jgi:predicted Rossmann-fold nucleotide-binding protein
VPFLLVLAFSLLGSAIYAAEIAPPARPPQSAPFPATFAEIPPLNQSYPSAASRAMTVSILGSSKDSPLIAGQSRDAGVVARELVRNGYNVCTGCGNAGILGAAYSGALAGRSLPAHGPAGHGENLAVVAEPAWGDENIKDARAIGKAHSEADRLVKFLQISDTLVIYPGGPATIQEAASAIARNNYRGSAPAVRILLVGRAYFQGLIDQYEQLAAAGLLKGTPDDHFRVVETPRDVLSAVLTPR